MKDVIFFTLAIGHTNQPTGTMSSQPTTVVNMHITPTIGLIPLLIQFCTNSKSDGRFLSITKSVHADDNSQRHCIF